MLPFPPHYSMVVKRKGSCQGSMWRYVLVKAETKQHVTGLPSPYSCDLSATLEREEEQEGKREGLKEGKKRGCSEPCSEYKGRCLLVCVCGSIWLSAGICLYLQPFIHPICFALSGFIYQWGPSKVHRWILYWYSYFATSCFRLCYTFTITRMLVNLRLLPDNTLSVFSPSIGSTLPLQQISYLLQDEHFSRKLQAIVSRLCKYKQICLHGPKYSDYNLFKNPT